MIPYDGLFFFYILAILLIPAIILGIRARSIKLYGIFVNIVFIILIFAGNKKQSICLLSFYLGELFLIKTYSIVRKKHIDKWIMGIAVFISIFPLILSKYYDLFLHKEIGFLGLSYLTFKVIQVIIEIHDGLIKKINIVELSYFLLFFPTISSGPIDRSRRFEEEINKIPSCEEYILLLRHGFYKITKGIFYKFAVGSIIAQYWMGNIVKQHSFLNNISYMYSYSLYLFFDFAGYSLMAVGVSYILGIKTPDNFNMPFLSKDIKDFWNRWHMSLSFWFRDYVYTRFVMLALKKKWFKSRYTASYLGYIVTMGTMGLWHGTHIYYILYGVYHGILIVFTDFIQRKSKWYKRASKIEAYNLLFTFITFNLVCFGFLIFSGYLFK